MANTKLDVLVVTIVLAAVVFASGCSRKSPEQRADRMMGEIAAKLDLNDRQKEKINEIKQEFLARVPAMQQTRQETFDQMITLMRSPSIDKNRLNQLAARNRASADDLISFIFAKYAEFHDVLTPEQREKAADQMEQWREQYREHYKEIQK